MLLFQREWYSEWRRHEIDLTPFRGHAVTLYFGVFNNGTVRNVVDFGAFVDIGVKHDGLLHKSRLSRNVALQVGDVIEVAIVEIDKERGRVGLGWKR